MWKSKEEMQMPASIAGAMCWASSPFPSTTLGSRCFETTDTCNSNCMGTTGEGQLCHCYSRNAGNADLGLEAISRVSSACPCL